MTIEYLEGTMPAIARELIHKSLHGLTLTKAEFFTVRNSLVLQLMLANFKRAGDIANLRREAISTAKYEDNDGEFYVRSFFYFMNLIVKKTSNISQRVMVGNVSI